MATADAYADTPSLEKGADIPSATVVVETAKGEVVSSDVVEGQRTVRGLKSHHIQLIGTFLPLLSCLAELTLVRYWVNHWDRAIPRMWSKSDRRRASWLSLGLHGVLRRVLG
jgi:hypothetical protein